MSSRNMVKVATWLALMLVSMYSMAQPAAPPQPLTAEPGKSGGEGGGMAQNVTVREATKESPILQANVGQPSAPPSGNDPESRCLRLAWEDFSRLKDAPTQVLDTAVYRATGNRPAMCVVNGYVNPQVGFRLVLPLTTWNGKYAQGGGFAAGITKATPTHHCEMHLVTRGYACQAADLGHKSTTYDSIWAIDNIPLQMDSGFRATHVSSIAGKAITEKFFGRPPKYSYHFGSSSGGAAGLREVQRFPLDFDGVIVGESGGITPGAIPGSPLPRGGRVLHADGKAVLSPDEIRMLHKAVMDRCDGQDGLKDGIITDPMTCDIKLRDLLCKGDKTSNCLTQSQVTTLEQVYATGPVFGSEMAWIGAFVSADGSPGRYNLVRSTNPYSNPYQFIFSDTGNVDIRPFKARGGKLIFLTGWADEIVNPRRVIAYYESVEALMGGRDKTQDFFRLFVIPGQSHIPGNVGAESIDYIKVMEAWVEEGKAPDVIIGRKLKKISNMMGPTYMEADLQPSNYLYSRPHYPYPIQARYKGQGDADDAASFGPWDPVKKQWMK